MYALTTVINSVSQHSLPASCSSSCSCRLSYSPYPRHCGPRRRRHITQGRRSLPGIYSHLEWISSRPLACRCSTSASVSVSESVPPPSLSSPGGHSGRIHSSSNTKNHKRNDGKIEAQLLLGCENFRKEAIKSKMQGRPSLQQGRRHLAPRLSLQRRSDCQELSRSPTEATSSVKDMNARKAAQHLDLLATKAAASTASTTSTSTSPTDLPKMDSKPVTEEPPSTMPTTPLTLRISRPKPSPISTRALKRAGSLPLNSTISSRDFEESGLKNTGPSTRLDNRPPSTTTHEQGEQEQVYNMQSVDECQQPGNDEVRNRNRDSGNDDNSADEGCRDSGIALEKWDVPQRLLVTTSVADAFVGTGTKATSNATSTEQKSAETRKEAFPCFSQLLHLTSESLDEGHVVSPSQQQLQSGNRRRQRCQSWMHPNVSRETDSDDAENLWSRSDVEAETKNDLNTRNGYLDDVGAENKGTAAKRKTRQKRVSSMVFGADLQSTLDAIASGLPPLPPMPDQQQPTKASALAPSLSSFFCPPPSKQQDAAKNKDRDNSSSSRRSTHSSNFSSSSSSSSSSSASATLNLSRSLSNPLEPPQAIPFSNLLDLATAKAENITGLYFARQLNMAMSQPTAIYSQNNISNSTLDQQQHCQQQQEQEQQEPRLNNQESPLSSTSTETVEVLENSVAASTAPVLLKIDPASPENNVTSGPVKKEAGLKVMGAQEALQSELACVRTDSNLPPLPVIHPTKATPGGAGPCRLRAATSLGSTSEQRTAAASLSEYSFLTNAEQTMELANVNGSPRLEANHPSLPTMSTNPTAARPTHRRSHSASHFFHLSSLKHHSPAQFNLALCYEHGQGGVEQDLAKAVHFYQQAADQGHTKASYNIGCICYNLGEIRKAIAWFEGAGKCKVRGLDQRPEQRCPSGGEEAGSLQSEPGQPTKIACPMPRQNSMFLHELEDFLGGGGGDKQDVYGDYNTTSGPFTRYLPAILCLALLCRQGIKDPRDESVEILKRDPAQATELLQRLLQKTPLSSSLSPVTDIPSTDLTRLQRRNGERQRQATSSASLPNTVQPNRDPMAVLESGPGQLHAAPQFSSSCPSLNLCESNSSSSSSRRVRNKRSSFVEDAVDHEADVWQGCKRSPVSTLSIPPPGSADAHETWAVQLAQRLLKIWQAGPSDNRWRGKRTSNKNKDETSRRKKGNSVTIIPSSSSQDQRILRYHLLYITNPTLSKNLYNLGVLYDLFLDDRPIAIQCYTFAFQNSTPSPGSSSSCPLSLLPTAVTDQQLTTMRINCAWNLGVLHVKLRQWRLAREWFLCAQQDIQQIEANENQKKKGKGSSSICRRSGLLDKGMREQTPLSCNDDCSNTQGNNVGHNKSGSDYSPSMRHARKHGVWMHLSSPRVSLGQSLSSSLPSPSTPSNQKPLLPAQLSSSSPRPPSTFCLKEETTKGASASGTTETTTDSNKIAWVLRWIDSKQNH